MTIRNLLRFAAALTLTLTARAQSLTANPGYTSTKLFDSTPGYVVAGVAAGTSNTLYYVESDAAFGGTLPTKLWSCTITDSGASAATLVHDFGTSLYGSFLTFHNGMLYFGDGTAFGLYAIDPTTSAVDSLGTLSSYDLAFSGDALFVSQYVGGGNKVMRYTLVPDGNGGSMLSIGDPILTAGTQFGGPLTFTDTGDLIYGSDSTGLYRFTAAEVLSAIGETELTLDGAHLVLANGANSYLASAGGSLIWRDSYNSTDLQLIDALNGNITAVASSGSTLGNLSVGSLGLFANVTAYGANTSSAVFLIVPEPSSAALLLFGLACCARRRR